MEKNKKIIKSMKEFEERYFPKTEKEMLETTEEPEILGKIWALETMRKVKKIIES